jgi:tetratricopeptide (TPR) repeat protein
MEGQGDYEQAEKLYIESYSLFRVLHDSYGMSYTLQNLGLLAKQRGTYENAISLLEESLVLQRELANNRSIADTLYHLGYAARMAGTSSQAIWYFQQSLTLDLEAEDSTHAALCLVGIASVFSQNGLPTLAAELLGTAQQVLTAADLTAKTTLSSHCEADIQSIRNQLDRETFALHHAKGSTRSLEQAILSVQSLIFETDFD